MTKDEMKSRISMALKDPVSQQGFEIICKENVKFASELQRCRDEIGRLQGLLADEVHKHKVTRDKLAKAKEIIKKFSEFVNNRAEYDPEHPQEYTDLWYELCAEAEQFLKEE